MSTDDIESLKRQKNVLRQTNETLWEQNLNLQSEIKVSRNDLDTLLIQEKTTVEHLRELETQEHDLQAAIVEIDKFLGEKQQAYTELEREYTTRKEKYRQDLETLDKKQQNMSQELLIGREDIANMRTELANRTKLMDERDKNLRLREAKVDQQEKAVIRNYNLLKL